jgi:hypothetical protein
MHLQASINVVSNASIQVPAFTVALKQIDEFHRRSRVVRLRPAGFGGTAFALLKAVAGLPSRSA